MPIITAVEAQKTPRLHSGCKRFNIFLDGQFAFGADEDLVVSERLIPGKVIEPRGLDKLLFEVEVGNLIEKLYGLFSVRQRSEKEVRNYFRIKNYELRIKDKEEKSQLVIDMVVERLKQKGMINDLEFAKVWVQSRRRSKQKGINALKSELFQKGIDKEIIEEVISRSPREAGQPSVISEEDLAKQALEKKIKSWQNYANLDKKRKAVEYLIRKGFDYNLAKSVVEKFLEKRYTTNSEIKESKKYEDDF